MVDVLRDNIKKLLEEVPQPILEAEDIKNLLDGYVDKVIKKHKNEDKIIENVKNEEINHIGSISKEQAIQYVTSFYEEYDDVAIKNIEDLKGKKSKKSKEQVKEFEDKKEFVLGLQEQFDI